MTVAAAMSTLVAPVSAQTTTETAAPETTTTETKPSEPTITERSASAPDAATPAATEAATDETKPPATETVTAEPAPKTKRPARLRIASWGGAYGQAQLAAIIKPAEKELSVTIQRVELSESKPVDQSADVLELRQDSLLHGCQKGDYLRRSEIQLAPSQDGAAPEADYLTGGLSNCGVASFAWSSLILFDRSRFKKRKPTRLSDVFDIRRFKGKRAFLRKPENLFEMLAVVTLKGTSSATVYEDLATRDNRDKVFARLEALLPHIVWVDTPSEALAKLESGDVIFAAGFSGRAFRKTIAGNISALWDGHVYDYLSWVVSNQAQNKELAKKFVELATSPARLAEQAKQWPYGPMRKSAAAKVGRHATLDLELAPFMPTSQIRLPQGLRRDAAFWDEHGERLSDRLAALFEGFPRGVRVPPPPRKPPPPAKADDQN